LLNFDILHAFLPPTVAKLSTLKNSPVFWPTLYIQPTLVTSARKDRVQGRSADFYRALHGDAPQYLRQFTSVADIPTRQTSVLLPRTICVFLLSDCLYCWTSCFLCRWRSCLERPFCRCHFSTFFAHFPKTFKIASLPTFLSWPCPVNYFFSFVVLVVAVCYSRPP